jgi:hypothetical protein
MIFEMYRDGVLEDDDEVAVAHEPGRTYAVANEAMVNIRRTLCEATRAGVVSDTTCRRLETIAKRMFYPDRAYDNLLAAARLQELPTSELDSLEVWLPGHRVDQKRADALLLLDRVKVLRTRPPEPRRADFTLARSRYLERLLGHLEADDADDPTCSQSTRQS